MNRLSSAVTAMKSHYEVVVIGSGYGGAIAASRMARAGRSVCVLERGREFMLANSRARLFRAPSRCSTTRHLRRSARRSRCSKCM